MAACTATTLDNPNNPFTHYDEWLEYDMLHRYNTNGLLAYFSEASPFMLDEDYEYESNLAVDRLIDFNPYGKHYKVYETDSDETIAAISKAYWDSVHEHES